MIFEDVQWIDSTSLEVLGRAVERLENSSSVWCYPADRSFKRPGLDGIRHCSHTQPARNREITAIIDWVTGNRRLPEERQARHCKTH